MKGHAFFSFFVNAAKKPKEGENCHTILEWLVAGTEMGPQVIGTREAPLLAGHFRKKRASRNCPSFFSVFSVAFVFFSSAKASFSAIYRLPLAQGETHLALISMAVVLLLARVLWVIISENRELRS